MHSTSERNDIRVGLCATVLRRMGPLTVKLLNWELNKTHKFNTTTHELASLLNHYGKAHGILTKRSVGFYKPFYNTNLIYYVSENCKTLEWWVRGGR